MQVVIKGDKAGCFASRKSRTHSPRFFCLGLLAMFVPLGLWGRIVISEIHYHPFEPGERLEFVELYNDEPLSFDVSRYRLDGTVKYEFPEGTVIEPLSVVVVAREPEYLAEVYGIEVPFGPFEPSAKVGEEEGRLGNDGGEIILRDTGHSAVCRVRYNDRNRWPAACDGAGPSLVLHDLLGDPGESESWGWSVVRGGTPGVASFEVVTSEAVINEVFRGTDSWIELFNPGKEEVDLSNYRLWAANSGASSYTLPPGSSIPSRGFLVLSGETTGLGLDPTDQGLFLVDPGGERIVDARRLGNRPSSGSEGRYPDGGERWFILDPPTSGSQNNLPPVPPVVISEIHYHPYSENELEEFIEITNTGTGPVDLSGFAFTCGISYAFPEGTVIDAGQYLVIAKDPETLMRLYGITGVLGPYNGVLADSGERVVLSGPRGNPVDVVRYFDEGTWPKWPDGDGPSLELVDLRQENAVGTAWQASDHAALSEWHHYEYTGVQGAGYDSEFHLYLMGAGEVLIDDIRIVAEGSEENYIPDGDFDGENPLRLWRVEGTHVESFVEPGVGPDGSSALHIIASRRGDTRSNRIERQTHPPLRTGKAYTVSFNARWLRGSCRLMTRSWGHGIARSNLLEVPPAGGTPGRANSRRAADSGPLIYEVEQEPALPAPDEPVVVRARVSDPDGVEQVTLFYRKDGDESFQTVPMSDNGEGPDSVSGDGLYAGTITGIGALRATAEFYIVARDSEGFERSCPPAAPGETFLYQYQDTFRVYTVPSYRIVMRAADYRTLRSRSWNSNHPLPASLVWRDERIFHRAVVRYRGSPWMRRDSLTGERKGFRLRLSDENPLRGSVRIMLDEQLADRTFQSDRLINYFMHYAGDVSYGERRHVDVIVAGRHLGTYEEVLVIDRLYLKRAFGEENADGELYKMDAYYEIDDGGKFYLKMPSWVFQTDKEKVRFNFKKRSGEKADDFSNLLNLLRVMDLSETNNYQFDLLAPATFDLKSWLNAAAVLGAAGDWDSFVGSTNKNVYIYYHPDGKWRVIPWDHDCSLNGAGGGTSPHCSMYPSKLPETTRLLTRRQNGKEHHKAVWKLLQGPYKNAVVDPILDEVYALLRQGPGASDPAARSNFVRLRREYLLDWVGHIPGVIISTNGGSPFTTGHSEIRLRGSASWDVESFLLGGEPVTAKWISWSSWEIEVPLECGENELAVTGLDPAGEEIGRDSILITYDGAPVVTLDPPNADIELCGGAKEVRFIAAATDPQDDSLSYEWSVTGNAVLEVAEVPVLANVTFSSPGEYTVSCAVSDGSCAPVVVEARVVVGECPGEYLLVGDSNCDGGIDVADAVCTLNYLFGSGESACSSPCCAANQDTNNDTAIDIADAVRLLGYLFGGAKLVGPGGRIGVEECVLYPSETLALPCAESCAK